MDGRNCCSSAPARRPRRRRAARAAIRPDDRHGGFQARPAAAGDDRADHVNVRRGGRDFTIAVSGPLVAGGVPWTIDGLDDRTVEVVSPPGGWLQPTQLAKIERDRAGKVSALVVSTGRIKRMRFERTG